MEKVDYYVYVIFRQNGVPCYVGKGRGRRSEHRALFSHNKHLHSIYKQSSGILPLVKIREHLTDKEACEIERAFIAAIGRNDLGQGSLVNFTDGGEGLSRRVITAETRAKLSKALKNTPRTEEWRANMSKSRKGKKESEETRRKKSVAHTGTKKPWVSEALKGKPNPGVRAAQLGRKSPENSARMMGNKYSVGKNTGESSGVPRKLTEEIVRDIRKRAADGERHQLIAADYNIHKSQVSAIYTLRTWKWVI